MAEAGQQASLWCGSRGEKMRLACESFFFVRKARSQLQRLRLQPTARVDVHELGVRASSARPS